jgi:hypothetical protein
MRSHFTVWFYFKEDAYKALVTMSLQKEQNVLFDVNVCDESLFHILPGGKLVFDVQDGLQTPAELEHDSASEMVLCITAAISKHLTENNINKIELS